MVSIILVCVGAKDPQTVWGPSSLFLGLQPTISEISVNRTYFFYQQLIRGLYLYMNRYFLTVVNIFQMEYGVWVSKLILHTRHAQWIVLLIIHQIFFSNFGEYP